MGDSERLAPSVRPRSVGVVGGGTAGYLAALAVKRRFPDVDVTVIESKDIAVIGVGEATTTLMPPFLHTELGVDIVELFREVRPTFKLGIEFEWGKREPGYRFRYPFGPADPVEAFAQAGDLRDQSLVATMMSEGRAPVVRGPDGLLRSILPEMKFAYHLSNAPLIAFLARLARRVGIVHEEMTVTEVVPRAGREGVDRLRGDDGRELAFDLYIDASGFRSLLLGGAAGVPFQSFEASLFCDRAVVATVREGRAPARAQALATGPYTTAETMDSGWCWRIPLEGEDHRGYVYASSHLSDDAAAAEMRDANPGMGEPSVVRFRSGRHAELWRGNVVALGNAYGFVEPLESTALHLVIVGIGYLLAGLEAATDDASLRRYAAFANAAVGEHWDALRWFLSLHYKFNRARDSAFWRHARADVDISGLQDFVRQYQSVGAANAAVAVEHARTDPAFGATGLLILMLGQDVASSVPPQAQRTREDWQARVARDRALAHSALPHAEALAALRKHPELLSTATADSRSWLLTEAERVRVLPGRRWPS